MPRIAAFFALIAVLFFAADHWISASVADEPAGPADHADLAATVKQIFRTRCFECHGDTRNEADIDVLDHASLVGRDRAVVPSSLDDSLLFELIASDDEDYRMPESPRPPLNRGEIETVRKWIEAGAPEFPADVSLPSAAQQADVPADATGTEYVLKQITSFVQSTPRADRPYLRFFSSNHLLTSGATSAELKQNQQALAKAVNHLSWEPDIVRPTVVDEATKTIFAVDIRQLGWHQTIYTAADSKNADAADQFDLFDLVLLEYPYGRIYENSDAFSHLVDLYLTPAGLIRPVPYVRIDWFVSVATQAPLYEDLLQLPHELKDLEDHLNVDSDENLRNFRSRRGGVTLSGVSRNNRVVERHPARYGAYWKSYDFETSRGLQNMFADPIEFHFAGGEMIWNLPNGLQAYLVTDNTGRRILEAPTSIVTDKFSEDRTVRNGLACIRCHDRGMKRFADDIRPAFTALPGGSLLKKQDILRLYATKKEMDGLLDKDENRFMKALEEALGEEQKQEPLVPVSRTYLDAPLTLRQAAAEIGLPDADALRTVFRLPQFTRLGLAGLSTGGVIRRDTWEDYFDRVARQLGTGVPVAPVDGLTRRDQLSSGRLAAGLKISTNRQSGVFSPGDEMVLTIENDTETDVFVELIGTSPLGLIAVLTEGVRTIKAGESLRIPETGTITIQPQLGTELVTVYASPRKFEPGRLFRGDDAADRFIHDFWQLDRKSGHVSNDPAELVKKTLKIETR